MFRSFAWGGFESASHKRWDEKRIDTLAGSSHVRWATLDFAILRSVGVRTIREAFRWHLIGEGRRDWSSTHAQMDAARVNGQEIAWDICHWGLPEGMDIMASDWPNRLADFAVDAVAMLRREGCDTAAFVPVNEMSFWAWAGGETGGFHPFLHGQGTAFKRQLVAGHLAVVRALRQIGSTTPIMVCEPLIWVLPNSEAAADRQAATDYIDASFEAITWILQEDPAALDVLGLNFYPHNQWELHGPKVPWGDPRWRPLASLLQDVAKRFHLPIVISETGAEEPLGNSWLRDVASEVATALRQGVPIEGVCIYPVADYPGWDDERHCPCGPLGLNTGRRFVRPGQADAMRGIEALRARTRRYVQNVEP